MSNLVLNEAPRYSVMGFNQGTAGGTSISTNLNSKGSYVQITAATPAAFDGFWVRSKFNFTINHLLDIGVGAPGAEQAIVPNLWVPAYAHLCTYFPLQVPAGVRMAVRGQNDAFNPASIDVEIIGKSWANKTQPGGYRCVTNADTTVSAGTSYDPGGSAGTFGSWATMLASVNFPVRVIKVYAQNTAFVNNTPSWLFNVGYGSAGNERAIISNLISGGPLTNTSEGMAMDIETEIPPGSRLVFQAMCNVAATPDRFINVQYVCLG